MKIERDYFRLGDLAKAWECSVEDIHHLFIHGKLKIGIACHGERLFGTNAELRTVGAYAVSGVLIIPSTSFQRNLRIQVLELDACLLVGELPVHAGLGGVAGVGPGFRFAA